MLAELMRLYATVSVTGTHGKTTTTSLIAHLFNAAGLDPTVITGGIINEWGSNARLGNGKWMIVEADESDGTFIKIPSQIGVVTNIDPEHLDYFKTVDNMHREFETFYPQHSLLRPGRRLHRPSRGRRHDRAPGAAPRRAPPADLRHDARAPISLLKSARVEGAQTFFDADLGPACAAARARSGAGAFPLLGHHNALNALAAIAAASEAGIGDDVMRKALAGFSGVKRRFQPTGTWNGVTIYDDYGHHPVEIAAVLKAAKAGARGRVIAVVEPHRYTRVRDLFGEFAACFKDADSVIVTPLYSAGELPIDGIDHAALAEAIRATGHARRRHRRQRARDRVRAEASGGARRHGRVPRRRQQHGMGPRPARLARRRAAARRRRGMSFPDLLPEIARADAGSARPGGRQCHAGGHHLVPRRRAGAGAVHAGRCGRSRLFPRPAAGATIRSS